MNPNSHHLTLECLLPTLFALRLLLFLRNICLENLRGAGIFDGSRIRANGRELELTSCSRTQVATLLPNEASLLRLVSVVLVETSDDWEAAKNLSHPGDHVDHPAKKLQKDGCLIRRRPRLLTNVYIYRRILNIPAYPDDVYSY